MKWIWKKMKAWWDYRVECYKIERKKWERNNEVG